jgi:hypothetical protein
MAHRTPEEKARARLQVQVSGAAAAAPAMGLHEGHWTLHHIALPTNMPGDFSPVPAPEYAEERYGIFALLGELLGLDADRARLAAECEPEAGA